MGGSIFVGVRTSDSVEHLGISWTNWLPRLFADPTFYEGGAALEELFEYWREEHGRGKREKRIHSSEYGAVLVDLKPLAGEKPQIWHCNGYSNFGAMIYNVGMTNEPKVDALAVHLLENKLYTKVMLEVWEKEPADETHIARVLKGAKAYLAATKDAPRGMFDIPAVSDEQRHAWHALPTLVIHTNFADTIRIRDYDTSKPKIQKSMVAWLKLRGWTSPTNKMWR